MNRCWAAAAIVILQCNVMAQKNSTVDLAHVRTEFHFTADLPYDVGAPLFGAWAEQKWAPEWKPLFLYPTPPVDQEGAVFRVDHGAHSSVWITTVFDLPRGRVQYVSVLNHVIITRIDIRLAKNGAEKTDVSVVYERTALGPDVNEQVRTLARADEHYGPEWKAAIDAYGTKLRETKAHKAR